MKPYHFAYLQQLAAGKRIACWCRCSFTRSAAFVAPTATSLGAAPSTSAATSDYLRFLLGRLPATDRELLILGVRPVIPGEGNEPQPNGSQLRVSAECRFTLAFFGFQCV